MTRNKAEKRATRARMSKTGERYTTARRYALDLHHPTPDLPSLLSADAPPLPELATPAVAELPPRVAEPAVSDAAVQRATGKLSDEWFVLLDAWDGATKKHSEIARYLHEVYGIDGWWAQNVTVGYERARGMRALHERPDGFSANASKTFPVPVERLFAAFTNEEERSRWLREITLRNRTSQPNKSARFDILPDDLRLAATFIAKGEEKSAVQLQLERLPDEREVVRWKAIWKAQFANLADYFAQEPTAP